MFSVKTKNYPHLKNEISSINNTLNQNGLMVIQIMRCEAYSLLFVYRPLELEMVLLTSSVSEFLESCGYNMSGSLEDILKELFSKLSCNKDFPHEVGVFLGYPLEYILGFVKYQGKNFKMFGYWEDRVTSAGGTLVRESLIVNLTPEGDDITACNTFGKDVASA